jgi:hypothetical protein
MKKMIFLMLTLMVLGAASVNAQVRIGGAGDPADAAVLDLNPNDNPTNPAANVGGLSLPRVALATENQQLYGKTPKPGTLVYNTGSVALESGTYVWTDKWIKLDESNTMIPLSRIATSPADSGKVVESNGSEFTIVDKGIMTEQALQPQDYTKPVIDNSKYVLQLYDAYNFDKVLPPYSKAWLQIKSSYTFGICVNYSGEGLLINKLGNYVSIFNVSALPRQIGDLRCYEFIKQ